MSEIDEFRVRVGDIEKNYAEVAKLVAMREEHSKNVSDKVDQIYDLLIGTTTDPGLKIRVDRLEQDRVTIKEHRTILYAGFVSLGLNAIWQWIKSK